MEITSIDVRLSDKVMQDLIIASKNKGKLTEFRDLFAPLGIIIRSMEEVGFADEIEEHGSTLRENAWIKAHAIYQKTGKAVLAEDSGLFVDALDGAPGIYSARFAGPDRDDTANNTLLLEQLGNQTHRAAHFAAVICLIDDHGMVRYYEGRLDGKIALKPEGNGGFGYDPVFIPETHHQTQATMTTAEKNLISHRARALEKMKKDLGL
ncbi:MAG: RdgB/HAM1 family non-canonical purine NTP pyrophosphatase [Saprospiraceae bacterium]|nr:RdgB/HAM1 family non-canonical purine NTP pyrophosphatase [Saprospiraceae bacterium]